MFRNEVQNKFLSIFYSLGSRPLEAFDSKIKNGSIRRVADEELKSLVLELKSSNVATTYISCPSSSRASSLGVSLAHLVLVVKNLGRYFSLEVELRDHTNARRRFRASNFQARPRVEPSACSLALSLEPGWNDVHLDLASLTRRVYGTNYVEACRLTVNASCRLRRIYFCDRRYPDDELPAEFRLFGPPSQQPEAVEHT